MSESNRVLILQYTPQCSGLGDFMRAAGSLKHFCSTNNIKFYLDITNHMGTLFDYDRYTGSTDGFITFKCKNDGKRFNEIMESLSKSSDSAIISTNCIWSGSWIGLDDYVHSLHTVFSPNTAIIEKHNTLLETHKLEKNKYNCIQIRYGDIVLLGRKWDDRCGRSHKSVEERIDMILAAIPNKEYPTVLITDNYEAKLQLAEKYTFRYFNVRPVHITHTNDTHGIEQTIQEFLTLTESAGIFAVSSSGFAKWAAVYGGKPYMCAQ